MIEEKKLKLSIEIPFNERGDQEGYSGGQMRKNYIFTDTLYYDTFTRGRSSVKFYFKDAKGIRYEMFATDFSNLVKSENVSVGVLGRWSFVKRGANFGIVKVV